MSTRAIDRSVLRVWTVPVLLALGWWALYRVNGPFWDWAVFELGGLEPDTRAGAALHFFLYDTVKILLLLAGIIAVVTILRSFMSLERTRSLLGGRREGRATIAAAFLGVATPFCSCSAVPAFVGFVAAGVPLGVTLAFLVASPLVNEVALVMLFGLFGLRVALLYVSAGLVIAIVAGSVLGRLRMERWVEPFVLEARVAVNAGPGMILTWPDRFALAQTEVVTVVRRILPFLLVGIGVGAVLHGWAPEDLFVRYAGPGNPLAVPVAVLLGIPLYSNAAGILPLVEVLTAKGLGMGTVLAFMMAVVALSLPEVILLRRVLRPRLIATFVAVVAAGILFVGFLFNAVLQEGARS
jgi:uncharacterized protein